MPLTTAHRYAWIALLALGPCGGAQAFVVPIDPDKRALYLRVGDGDFSKKNYYNGGKPGSSSGPANLVWLDVPAAQVGNSIAQPMNSTSRPTSDWDDFTFCSTNQTYIGGFYRSDNTGGSATLTATVTADLTSPAGDTIAFSQISWTSSGNGDTGPQPVPGGSFTGNFASPVQALTTFPVNSWRESCHRFSYANSAVRAAGTYTGTVLYTLTSP